MRSTAASANRIVAWGIVAAIVLASLLPSDRVTRTRAGGEAEHVAAYAVAMLAMAPAYPTVPLLAVTAGMTALASSLEFLQRFSPGRRSALADLAFSVLGIGLGCLLYMAGRAGLKLATRSRNLSRSLPCNQRTGMRSAGTSAR
jgi:hypothetical protein